MSSSADPGGADRLARSLLFVPGDRADRFSKAATSGAHQVILDLEDAVPPPAKTAARVAVAAWLAEGHSAVVRINAAGTDWHAKDLAMLRSRPGADVMLPKADAGSLAATAGALPGRGIIALLETVDGLLRLRQLAAAPGLTRIAFGSIDFSIDSGICDEGDAMTAIRTQIVLESRLAGLPAPVDGVSTNFAVDDLMLTDARRSRQLGFGGKLCIHPRQAVAVNQAFEPTPEEVLRARRILAAFEASGGAATALDGRMVDKPVVDWARRVLGGA